MKSSYPGTGKTLLLVDGSSFLYRAFHAMPDLRNREGFPTGAIYGVLNMLRKLRHDYPADYSLCVFDAKGKTFRDDMYPEYKAHRPSMPEDLARQIEPLHQAIVASGWNILALEGVEADDVIGTLVQQAARDGVRSIVATGDKDLAQLVNEHVTLVNTMSNETLDVPGVSAKFGVPPERIIDYLTLTGDAVDNVPGVEKVGPKTAVKWLTQYGTLDNVMQSAGGIGGVVGENLRKALDWLPQARRLLTVKCDVELPQPYSALVAPSADYEQLRTLYERFEFKSWLRELNGEAPSAAPASRAKSAPVTEDMFGTEPTNTGHAQYDTILTEAQLDAWLEKLLAAELVCVDTETTGLDVMDAQLVGMSFAITPHHAAYLPLAHIYPGAPDQLKREQALHKLKPWLESARHHKVGQNLKYDMHIFANHGIVLAGIHDDTLLQSYVLESHRPHDMDNLALRHLNVKTISYTEVVGKGAKQIGFDQVDIDTATRYAAEDADITLQLHQALSPQIAVQSGLQHVYRDIELPTMQVLYRMERNGVLLDCALLQVQSRELGEKLLALEAKAHEAAGQPFNLNSPKQIQEILFNKLQLPVKKKTPSGTPSTDEEVLQELALDYPLPKILLDYRGMAKLKSTYTDKLPQMVDRNTGRVHTSYSQAVAVTGRLASSDPNLQNIPVRTAEGRRIREAFVAPQGSRIVSADYSQIELRIMAHLSGDEGLLRAFANGEDIHRATAAEIFMVAPDAVDSEQRRYAKVINFGLIYGMSAFGLAKQLGIERGAATAYIDRYFARYPGVADYMQRTREQAKQQGFVETVFGRRLWLPEINASNGMKRQAAERAAINAPMQGTAADLIKLAMIAVQHWLEKEKLQTQLIMQVHDELVLEVPENELPHVKEKLRELMCHVAELKVPLEVGLGEGANWEAAH
ncbi:DNA polymerase I [Ferrigenium kumadai]|uniref:DNA polymerase I n=1 Tax=Ferrigenium kumadai TaxID=1682490 RepID=A0AAN1T1I5_9PROT|nr:DNA polymerase I [Ferrigenium kumadai]BBJ00572.1 DNA polymerase I [Ferrigenium kumadai]